MPGFDFNRGRDAFPHSSLVIREIPALPRPPLASVEFEHDAERPDPLLILSERCTSPRFQWSSSVLVAF